MTNAEQRLADAFARTDRIEPSPDLWSRVVHSIEEDRLHRGRLLRTAIAAGAVLAALVVVALLALTDGPAGSHVRWQVMEVLETIALVVLIIALGPAIGRFGRGYASDLFTTSSGTGRAMLRLLDLAYFLIFGGYILLTVKFLAPRDEPLLVWSEQLGDASIRIAGLLLTMGMLHAITLVALPLLALIVNSTRTGSRVPRWIWLLLIVGGILAWQFAGIPIALIGGS
jgi:hypothetical protein